MHPEALCNWRCQPRQPSRARAHPVVVLRVELEREVLKMRGENEMMKAPAVAPTKLLLSRSIQTPTTPCRGMSRQNLARILQLGIACLSADEDGE